MLSILYDEYLKWGCPNCGCDAIKGSCVSGGGLTSGTCRHCGIHFEVRSDNPTMKCLYGAYPENPSDPVRAKFRELLSGGSLSFKVFKQEVSHGCY